ncbi:substrate-binding periplasmic protein [Marinomonas aquimarina]|nr:transporter substrate-binding domain-containing protein [Marinomonas aquimarina]
MKKALFPLVTSCLCLFSSATLRAQEALTFYVVSYPPYIIVSEDTQQISGIDVDVTRAAFASQGVSVEFKTMPWNRVVKSIEQGRILGTLSCSQRPGREEYMYFSDELSAVSRAVVSRKELVTDDITQLLDLSDYSVVTVDGWGMQKQLQSLNIAHQTSPDLSGAIKAVRYRNIDLLYMASYPAQYYVKQLGVEKDLKVTPLHDELSLSLYVCISSDYPNSDHVLTTVNNGLQQIKENGLYDQIRSRYLQTN